MAIGQAQDEILFEPRIEEFIASRKDKPYTALSGPNNSGKSLILKWLKRQIGRSSYLVGVNRFYHVYHFSPGLRDPNEVNALDNQFNSQFNQKDFNYEQNFIDLNRVIIGLSNPKRNLLFQLCEDLLGNKFVLKRVEPDNDLSVSYIDMDGQNISVGSTGTRLLMTILGICMDDRFNIILLDEPELGLGPKAQASFSNFLQDTEKRLSYFPHLRQVILATHSHIFLNHIDIQDNFVISKENSTIHLRQVSTVDDFHRLQFNLLGNSLETMYFPSAIIVVEGKCDFNYIERVLQLRFSGKKITIIPSNGDVKRKVAGLREAFGDLSKSPYHNRLFAVLDEIHSPSLVSELETMGVKKTNIIEWTKNGIEYLYPKRLISEVFACSPDRTDELVINGDQVQLNGINKTKTELNAEVVKKLDSTIPLPKEFEDKLLNPITAAIN